MPALRCLWWRRQIWVACSRPVVVHHLRHSVPAVNNRGASYLDFHSSKGFWKQRVLMSLGCCSVFGLLDLQYFVADVMCFLKLVSRGTKCVNFEWSIRRWQVREPLSLIPICNERESLRLGSVLRLSDLQPNVSLPLVHLPVRLL